jgi:hypothetical protein
MMKQVTIRLKTELIRWALFGDLQLDEQTPTMVLDTDSAAALMADVNAHLLEVVSEADANKRNKKTESEGVVDDPVAELEATQAVLN